MKRLSFENVLKNIDLSSSNLKLLEEWIDYKKVKSQCENFGLTEFLELMHEKGISTDKIINIFNKRFYTLWLDKAYEISPSVANFRRRIQDQRVLKFKELDKQQFKISEARIKEKLMKNLPSPSKFTNGSDELRILKREASKQRRIMPLRQLFASIPNLILSLKPCLMMSPLSVSVFLATDAFKFDVVIFDEASQVQTENAIGAIFRGKQVIIAGDSKQLPPTNFFNVSNDNDDFYDEDDMASNETYESILDEANLLPEKTLLWHYRSRHESLIAFSNAKIYNNRLTTFPSNISEGTDVGVEYIYVDKGLYDRGGRKGNVLEAKRVAKLVFEHFKLHPNKSLGVIAFGEVQQQAIDNEITQMRLQNKDFESFFNEELPEPFFVKNLENVQGDERDTIIFSIGYGFDVNGDFKMNFGPLSRVGGERRLNVAVTRAKYNIKLVGSIKPTDINLDRVSTEGPKLLRKYIEFAIQGQSVLEKEIKEDGYVSFDSPFEKSVYNFLDRNGYNVATQVGCSGYKIDLAIKHPQKSGVYTLAIECDGAAYHSGRNARERDRLRQEVLENMGWKFYRIWSTDWIKDSISEGKKLLDVVEKSIIEYDADNFELDFINLASEENNEKQYITLKSKTKEDFVTEYGFKKYMDESNLKGKHWNSLGTINERIFNLVKIAYPIDLETICYECKMFYGREKVTKVVREDIQYRLSTLNDKIIKIDNYY
ncbi:AAA domain-containing protein, partial [Faecalitalea cylindroides]|uniref:AAA domain-containing protein n=1 Tax=Faecalitalea cylindroides TaxID=39483 RepID=UPI001E4A16F2